MGLGVDGSCVWVRSLIVLVLLFLQLLNSSAPVVVVTMSGPE